jgi:hypothetical protein
MPKGAIAGALKHTADTIDAYLAAANLGITIDRRWFAQYALFGYLAQFLQVPYAHLFRDRSETELDRLLQAFRLKNCVANQAVLDTICKHLD